MSAKQLIKMANRDGLLGRVFGSLSRKFMEKTARSRIAMFEKEISGSKVLDIGLGSGAISWCLKQMGYKVASIDVEDKSLYKEIKLKIYGGSKIPYKSNSFDTGLLICVLHHCGKNQVKVLKEAMRTAKRLIILEDTYRNRLERLFVSARDMVGNFEFYDHNYRTVDGWKRIFSENGWKVVFTKEWSNVSSYGMYGRQVLFVVDHK